MLRVVVVAQPPRLGLLSYDRFTNRQLLPGYAFPSGKMMKLLAFIMAAVFALAAGGCVHVQPLIDGAESGTGNLPKTRFIEA